ncbi:MAG: hypothetical protein K2Y32_19730 [Candidatus Obscuribacterales bacterium]|nr:hypothetical protein [Candidatus Obscuribacterales bacterium]
MHPQDNQHDKNLDVDGSATAGSASRKPRRALWATIVSTLLWVASIVLAFVIKPGAMIFIPDSLLLLGFVPLLWLWHRWWLTLCFGILNAAIGFFLLILAFLPREPFPPESLPMLDHLIDWHSPWAWMVIGGACALYGTSHLLIKIGRWLGRKLQQKA